MLEVIVGLAGSAALGILGWAAARLVAQVDRLEDGQRRIERRIAAMIGAPYDSDDDPPPRRRRRQQQDEEGKRWSR